MPITLLVAKPESFPLYGQNDYTRQDVQKFEKNPEQSNEYLIIFFPN